jgi:hypothetical protein
MKICGRCKEEKELHSFGKKGNGYQSYCIPCRRIKQKEWVAANPQRSENVRKRAAEWTKNNPERAKANRDKYRLKNIEDIRERSAHQHRQRTYGINQEDYENMLNGQDGVCAICKNGSKLWVDHSHSTGMVRGLLCPSCNTLVGYIETHGNLIDKAKNYIKDFE